MDPDFGGVRVFFRTGGQVDLKLGDPWSQTAKLFLDTGLLVVPNVVIDRGHIAMLWHILPAGAERQGNDIATMAPVGQA